MVIAVVLGHQLQPDGTMSEIGIERCERTLRFIETEHPDAVILSGGPGKWYHLKMTEAEAMAAYLTPKLGDTPLHLEKASRSTLENAMNSVPIIKELLNAAPEGEKHRIVLISSKNHLHRFPLKPIHLFRLFLPRVYKKRIENCKFEG